MPGHWCEALIQFLKGSIPFLVGNQLTAEEMQPESRIKQGGTLSPIIFSLSLSLSLSLSQRFSLGR